ncbi:hypothetical protein BHE74_00031175, partial [Ensete ventricosum]
CPTPLAACSPPCRPSLSLLSRYLTRTKPHRCSPAAAAFCSPVPVVGQPLRITTSDIAPCILLCYRQQHLILPSP